MTNSILKRAMMLTAMFMLVCGIVRPIENESATVVFREDFEKHAKQLNDAGWIVPDTVKITTVDPQSHERCLEICSPQDKKYAEYFIPVKSGKWYGAECRVRCKDVKCKDAKSRGAVVFLQFAGEHKEWIGGGSFPRGLNGDKDWTWLKVDFTRQIPENVAYIQLMIGLEGATGTAWFDNIIVEEVKEIKGPDVISPVENEEVSTSLPLLNWKNEDNESKDTLSTYAIQVSQNTEFPPGKTIEQTVSKPPYRLEQPLQLGKWHWRIQKIKITPEHTKCPPSKIHTFIVNEKAAQTIWPPIIKPLWSWSPDPMPILSAYIGPDKVAAIDDIKVLIDEIPVDIVSYENSILKFRPKADLQPALHTIKIAVRRTACDSVSEESYFCNKRLSAVFNIRHDNVLLLDGKPFFPLGSYRDPSDKLDDFSGLLEAGFNVTHDSYYFENNHSDISNVRKYLDDADKNGLKVFLGFEYKQFQNQDYGSMQKLMFEIMDCPGLLTWYMPEEPIGRRIREEDLSRLYRQIKAVDKVHPASLLLYEGYLAYQSSDAKRDYRGYIDTCDIVWTDPYPIPEYPLTMIEVCIKKVITMSDNKKPVWAVLQAFDYNYYNSWKAGNRPKEMPTRPTPLETRFMAYLALSAGATGLIWYWEPNKMVHMRNDTPVVWQGLCDTVREMKSLMPFLTAEKTENDVFNVPAPFRSWTRQVGDKRILVLLNTSEKAADMKLDLSGFNPKTTYSYPDNSAIVLTDKTLDERFNPYEVKVYLLDKPDKDVFKSIIDALLF